MLIDNCTLNKQKCMIYHFNQNDTADAKRYHTCLYVKCTMIYDHICTQFWRSVSASAVLTLAHCGPDPVHKVCTFYVLLHLQTLSWLNSKSSK